jgi:hypothetical protein
VFFRIDVRLIGAVFVVNDGNGARVYSCLRLGLKS